MENDVEFNKWFISIILIIFSALGFIPFTDPSFSESPRGKKFYPFMIGTFLFFVGIFVCKCLAYLLLN